MYQYPLGNGGVPVRFVLPPPTHSFVDINFAAPRCGKVWPTRTRSSRNISHAVDHHANLMTFGTHVMLASLEVKGEATLASVSERDIPAWAAFKA